MGKSTPSAPAAPNPVTTASAQGSANAATATAQTMLNNVNQNTPYGSESFNQTGSYTITQPDGTTSTMPIMTETQSLSPDQQRLFNQQNMLSVQANNAASLGLNTANQALANPVTNSNLPALTTSFGTLPQLATGYGTTANATGYDQGGAIQTRVPVQQADTSFGSMAGGVQYDVDTQGIQQATNDATNAALARLQPSMDQQNAQLQAQLANQGVTLGSSAYGAAQFNQAQQQNDLRLGAVQIGDQEQQALYNEALQSGQFNNAAQAQDFSQQQARGEFQQAGVAANNASALAAGQFANAAQSQQNQENAAQAVFYNQGVNANNANNAALAAFGNTSAQQHWQNRLQGATFGNQAREQSLTDQETMNNNVINQISSLMHGGAVTPQQYQGYSAGTLDQTPLSSDTYATAGLENQQYLAQLQNSAQNTAAMGFALGGIMGGFGRKSDRRLKSEVTCVAFARNGLPIYRYRLAGEDGWHLGFMADEVALLHPCAVWTDPDDGWARVDYEKAVA